MLNKKSLDVKFYFVFGNIGLEHQRNDVHLYFKLPLLFFMLIMLPILKYDRVRLATGKIQANFFLLIFLRNPMQFDALNPNMYK